MTAPPPPEKACIMSSISSLFSLDHTIFRLIPFLSVLERRLVDATLATQSGISTGQIKCRHAENMSERPWDVKVKEQQLNQLTV